MDPTLVAEVVPCSARVHKHVFYTEGSDVYGRCSAVTASICELSAATRASNAAMPASLDIERVPRRAGRCSSAAAAATAPQTPLFVLAANSASSVLELGL